MACAHRLELVEIARPQLDGILRHVPQLGEAELDPLAAFQLAVATFAVGLGHPLLDVVGRAVERGEGEEDACRVEVDRAVALGIKLEEERLEVEQLLRLLLVIHLGWCRSGDDRCFAPVR